MRTTSESARIVLQSMQGSSDCGIGRSGGLNTRDGQHSSISSQESIDIGRGAQVLHIVVAIGSARLRDVCGHQHLAAMALHLHGHHSAWEMSNLGSLDGVSIGTSIVVDIICSTCVPVGFCSNLIVTCGTDKGILVLAPSDSIGLCDNTYITLIRIRALRLVDREGEGHRLVRFQGIRTYETTCIAPPLRRGANGL